MIRTAGQVRVLVKCPHCLRPIALSPGPVVVIDEHGQGYDEAVLTDALLLHLRLGCDST